MSAPQPMRLNDLLAGIAVADADCRISSLAIDSRAVIPGACFMAFPGVARDGREFIADAVARGAAAVVYEANGFPVPAVAVPCVGVPRLRERLGAIADRFYGAPSRELIVIGVTGTNGKTTCTQLLAQALDEPQRRCAIIGTLGYGFPGALDASLHTTPDAVTVHRLLRAFRAQGAGCAAMEVSSHALDQGRVNAVHFDVAVFTNLTRDHLDYHGDMTSYGQAKAALFALPGLRHAVINADDEFGCEMLARLPAGVAASAYGIDVPAGRYPALVRAREVVLTRDGQRLHVDTPRGPVELASPLLGRFNAYNLLAVLATLLALGVAPQDAARRMARAQAAAGRMERFGGHDGAALVVVDYAHTPDALQQVLRALRAHTLGQLVCVFGCGGDRDRGKRPQMGRIAENLADRVILTDDNPRTEDPEAIIADIQAGMHAPALVIRERRSAIAHAIAEAGAEDIVLVAGKGHEDYQQIGTERLPYSDRETVQELLGRAA